MGIFDSLFGKKSCGCGCSCGEKKDEKIVTEDSKINLGGVTIKILGSGCQKCNTLEENTVTAIKELGLDLKIEHVKDFSEIAKYGVMSTPALCIGDKVVSSGKVLTVEEVKNILKK